jgi:hypothetical protein
VCRRFGDGDGQGSTYWRMVSEVARASVIELALPRSESAHRGGEDATDTNDPVADITDPRDGHIGTAEQRVARRTSRARRR